MAGFIQGLSPELAAAMMTPKVPDMSPLTQLAANMQKQRLMDRDFAIQQEKLGWERQNFQDQQQRKADLAKILDPANPNFKDVPPQLVEIGRAMRDPSPIVQHYVNSQKGTDDIREYQFARQQGFTGQFSDWMTQKRKAGLEFGKAGSIFQGEDGLFYTIQFGTDGQRRIEPVTRDGKPLRPAKGVKQVGDELVDIGTGAPVRNVAPQIQNQQVAEEVGKDLGKLKASAPRLIAAQETMERDHRVMRDEIDKTREIAARSPLATGVPALLTSIVPGTTGYQVAQLLKTIKARAGFGVLGDMRTASPTGGALGAITERELEFLQSVQGSLEQVQSQEDLDRILERLVAYQESANDTRRRVLEHDLKRVGVAPELLNRQQILSPFTRNAQDTTKTPDGGQREFVGMQVDSRPGIPVAPQQAAPPAQPQVPLPRERRAYATPPPEAVTDLMREPSPAAKAEFDQVFGPGSADAYLKGRR